MGFKIDAEEFKKAMKNKKIDTRKVIAKNLAEMHNRAEELTPYDTGELLQSRRSTVKQKEGEFAYIKNYAAAVEHGHTRGKAYIPGRYFLKRNALKQKPIFINDLIEELKK